MYHFRPIFKANIVHVVDIDIPIFVFGAFQNKYCNFMQNRYDILVYCTALLWIGLPLRKVLYCGLGMEWYAKKIQVGCRVSNNFQLRVGLGMGSSKTLPESTCITGKVIHRHKGFQYVSTATSNFPWPQTFSAFFIVWWASNQSIWYMVYVICQPQKHY